MGESKAKTNNELPMKDSRTLGDLVSVGPAMLRDFQRLGIRSVAQLARANPERLCEVTGKPHDICGLDVFSAAVAQARDRKSVV